MKKILLASTALVATTGFAAAEMSWSGSANMGMTYSDNGTTKVHTEIDLGMAATGETDGGIGWKVEMGLDSILLTQLKLVRLMLDQFQYLVTLVQSVLVLLQQRVQQLALVTSVLMVQPSMQLLTKADILAQQRLTFSGTTLWTILLFTRLQRLQPMTLQWPYHGQVDQWQSQYHIQPRAHQLLQQMH